MEACGTGVQLISKVGSINTWEFSEPLYPPGSRWTGDCQEVIRVDAPESLEVLHVYLHAALKTEQDQLGHWKARLFKYYQCERALWDSACHRFQPQYRLKQIEGIFQKIKRGLKVAKKGVVSISAVRRLGQGCDSLNRGSPGEPRAPVAVCDEHTVERVEKGSAQAGAGESLVRHEEAGAAAEQRVEELGEREALVWDAGGAGEWSADAGNWSGGAAPEGLEEGSATGWARGGVANPGLEPERKGCATNGELTGQTKKRSLDDVSSGAHCRGDNQTSLRMLTSEETKLLDLPDPDTSVGRGSYGVIFRVEVIAGSTWARVFPDHIGSIIAVKEYQASDRPFPGTCTVRTVQNVTYEFLLASLFDHENVVRPFAVSIIGPDDPLAFFPYYSEGSLRRVLKKRRERSLKEPLSTVLRVPEVLAEACLGLLRGIQHVHSKGIVHCDLTDNNILVRLDEKGSAIVLAVHDFGIASRLVDNRTHRRFKTIKEEEQYAATRPHVARELVIGAPFSKESDMYAIGILLRDFLNLENGVRREQLTRERDWEEAVTLVERLTEKLASWRPKCEKVIEAFEKLRQRDRTSLAKRKLF